MRTFGVLIFVILLGSYSPLLAEPPSLVEPPSLDEIEKCDTEENLKVCKSIANKGQVESWRVGLHSGDDKCSDGSSDKIINPKHQGAIRSWAYGYFAYLTGSDGKHPRFENYAPVQLLYPAGAVTGWPGDTYPDEYFASRGIELCSGAEPPNPLRTLFLKEKGQPAFSKCNGNGDEVNLNWSLDLPGVDRYDHVDKSESSCGSDSDSVGGDRVLVDQWCEPVYYDIRVSKKFYDVVQKRKLNTRCGFAKFAARRGSDLNDGSALLKTAWRILPDVGTDKGERCSSRGGRDGLAHAPEGEYAREAFVYDEVNRCYEKRTAVLVGMNVAVQLGGGLDGFLWAAFENIRNLPNCDEVTDIILDWPFHDGSTECESNSGCNEPRNPSSKRNGVSDGKGFDSAERKWKPTIACREAPWGEKALYTGSFNSACLFDLNTALENSSSGVWKNYVGTGVLWELDPGKPMGALSLGNAVIETYAQGMSCTSCHGRNVGFVNKDCFEKACGEETVSLPVTSPLYQAKVFMMACGEGE